jgi:hypothetical protein
MSDTDAPYRPVRMNRTAVPTYNLKALTNEGLVWKPSTQGRDRQSITPSHAFHSNVDIASLSQQRCASTSSSLSSPPTSPRVSSVDTSQHNIAVNPLNTNTSTAVQAGSISSTTRDSTAAHRPTYECFNKHGSL